MSAVGGRGVGGWLYWVGLGANLGDPEAQLEQALEALEAAGLRLEQRSSWWRTVPVGGPTGQPDYLNGVARLRGRRTPMECLRLLQQVEWAAGRRRRGAPRWGARLLDLDLLDVRPPDGERARRVGAWGWVPSGNGAADGAPAGDPRLVLPHPRLGERAFVLGPWEEINPSHELPCGGTVASLLARLGGSAGG
ncbi:MAG: 2-amino-4-hydroxy-6-hydroxymethyldihydropteridine diphosphokinase [Planctomycetota bacterium]